MSDWRCEGTIYRAEQRPHYSEERQDLYAPDVVQGSDGRYYLYPAYICCNLTNEKCQSSATPAKIPQYRMSAMRETSISSVLLQNAFAGAVPWLAVRGQDRRDYDLGALGCLAAATMPMTAASIQTPFGKAGAEWKFGGDTFTLNVTVPVPTVCTVTLPNGITEKCYNGKYTFEQSWT